MKREHRIVKARELVERVEDAYRSAHLSDCSCGRDPEGSCDFCSKATKAYRLWEELKKLVTYGLE